MKEPKHISEYDNYVFDLYGTFIAMRNDEEGLPFWRQMSGIYTVYGADYTAAELRREYKRLCREEEKKLIAETGTALPFCARTGSMSLVANSPMSGVNFGAGE